MELMEGLLTSLEGSLSPILDLVTGLTLDKGPEAFFDSALSITLGLMFSFTDFLTGVVIFLAEPPVFLISTESRPRVGASPELLTCFVLGLVAGSSLSLISSILVRMIEEFLGGSLTVSTRGLLIEGFLSSAGEAVISRSAGDLFLGELSGVSCTRKASGLSLLSINIPPEGLSIMSPGEKLRNLAEVKISRNHEKICLKSLPVVVDRLKGVLTGTTGSEILRATN